MTVSETRGLEGPVYLDASAWVKLYVQEPESDALNAVLLGRTDVFVSDLAATEVASALGRASRERRLDRGVATRVHRRLRHHVASGVFQRLDLTPRVHAEAERLLLGSEAPLRAADALHVAVAVEFDMATIVTYDPRLAGVATSAGLIAVSPGTGGG